MLGDQCIAGPLLESQKSVDSRSSSWLRLYDCNYNHVGLSIMPCMEMVIDCTGIFFIIVLMSPCVTPYTLLKLLND